MECAPLTAQDQSLAGDHRLRGWQAVHRLKALPWAPRFTDHSMQGGSLLISSLHCAPDAFPRGLPWPVLPGLETKIVPVF